MTVHVRVATLCILCMAAPACLLLTASDTPCHETPDCPSGYVCDPSVLRCVAHGSGRDAGSDAGVASDADSGPGLPSDAGLAACASLVNAFQMIQTDFAPCSGGVPMAGPTLQQCDQSISSCDPDDLAALMVFEDCVTRLGVCQSNEAQTFSMSLLNCFATITSPDGGTGELSTACARIIRGSSDGGTLDGGSGDAGSDAGSVSLPCGVYTECNLPGSSCAEPCPREDICVPGTGCEPLSYSGLEGVVEDETTGLYWLQTPINQCAGADGGCTWADAVVACGDIAQGAFESGWTLPTIEELYSLVLAGSSPAIFSTAFSTDSSDTYWSSTSTLDSDGLESEWGISFQTGDVAAYSPDTPLVVRCVHAQCGFDGNCGDNAGCALACGASEICTLSGTCVPPDYTLAGGVVVDHRTHLTWQSAPMEPVEWSAAEPGCTQIDGNDGGWRLPDIEELFSLFELGSQPSISGDFSDLDGGVWSSSLVAGAPGLAWEVDFHAGAVVSASFGTSLPVLCVH